MFDKRERVIQAVIEALLATNQMLRDENRDMHNRLMVRFPQEFGQFMAQEMGLARTPTRAPAEPEAQESGFNEPFPEEPIDMVLSGSRRVVPPIVNQELAEDRGR